MVYTGMSKSDYTIFRSGYYYYFRRVPKSLQEFDSRTFIKIALKTDSRIIALGKAKIINAEIENYWKKLTQAGEKHTDKKFHQTIQFAKQLGYTYLPQQLLSQEKNIENLLSRTDAIEKYDFNQAHVEALYGGINLPVVTLTEALNRFWDYTKDRILKKNERQVRKWKNPRIKAIRNFSTLLGNKPLSDLTRDDVINFRDWWITNIQEEGYVAASANKDLVHVKNIIETVNDNLKLNLDTTHLFKKITLDENDSQTRPPFTTNHILEILLVENHLSELTSDEKWFLYAMAETGARDSELINLTEKHIFLNDEIPHIFIDQGKTVYSKRKIPLVGYALDAFQNCPKGFTSYYKRSDEISTYLNKLLRKKGLFPSELHSLYSLRHSFQDRILAVDTPDRVQAELMGHRFNRPSYGDGPSLEQKRSWMQKVQLKKT